MAKDTAPVLDDDDFDGSSASEWFARNAAWITTVLAIIALSFAGWYLYQGFERSKNEKATETFSTVYFDVQLAKDDTDTTARLRKLKEAAQSAAKAADSLGRHPLATRSLLLAGNALFEASYGQPRDEAAKSLNEAISFFDRYIAAAASDFDKAVGTLAKANALDNLGFLTNNTEKATDAAKAYAEAAALAKGTALELEARLGSARLLLAQPGREQEAVTILQGVAASSRALADSGITRQMRANSNVTTHTVRGQNEMREMSQAEIERLRRLEFVSLGEIARELLERAPALTTGTVSGS